MRLHEALGNPAAYLYLRYKRIAAAHAGVRAGATVVVFCCGSGLEFEPLLDRVGPTGRIIGIDFSPGMLTIAHTLCQQQEWRNISLDEADVTRPPPAAIPAGRADAVICTPGLSIIQEYGAVLDAMCACARPGGRRRWACAAAGGGASTR